MPKVKRPVSGFLSGFPFTLARLLQFAYKPLVPHPRTVPWECSLCGRLYRSGWGK